MLNKNVSKTSRHYDREDLAGEYIWGDLGQLILLVIFLTVWILDSFILNFTNFLSSYISIYIKIPLSVVFFSASGFLAKRGLHVVFGVVRTKPRVIYEGVFSIIRHPIYLGAILFYLSLWVLTFSLVAFFIWIVIILFYYFISKHEEILLLKKFGKDYEDYSKKVPMLLPCKIKRRFKDY